MSEGPAASGIPILINAVVSATGSPTIPNLRNVLGGLVKTRTGSFGQSQKRGLAIHDGASIALLSMAENPVPFRAECLRSLPQENC